MRDIKTIPPDLYQILLAVIEVGRKVDDYKELQYWLDILEKDLNRIVEREHKNESERSVD